jgi:hypothetical protein
MAYTTVGMTSEPASFGIGALEYHVASFDDHASSAGQVGMAVGEAGSSYGVGAAEIERERVRT